jgi:DNA-binding MltR family transcriptional regulator
MSDTIDELAALIRDKAQRAETSLALTTAALIEDWLEHAIKSHMRELSSTQDRRIFGGYGPLSSFAARIDVAYALSYFDDIIYSDLRAIKEIRNKFAHSKSVLHFNSEPILESIRLLTGWTKQSEPQALFLNRAIACIEALKPHLEHNALMKALMAWRPATSPEKGTAPPDPHSAAPGGSPKGTADPPQSSEA